MQSSAILQIFVLFLALSFHEMAHAWAAKRLGDPTAEALGRLTMNPIAHIDPFGTILFPAMLLFSGLPVFGWAKPVPVNPRNFRNPRRDDAIVAAAGPISNIFLAVCAAVMLHIIAGLGFTQSGLAGAATQLFFWMVFINLLLAFFNLIPLPPLDGGGVLTNLLPPSMEGLSQTLRQYGFLILLLIIFTRTTWIFTKPAYLLTGLLLPG